MRPRPDHSLLKLAAVNAALLLGLAALAALAYVAAGRIHLELIVRLAAAAAAAGAFLQVIGRRRRMTERAPPAEVEMAVRPAAIPPSIAPRLLKLRDELKHGNRSRPYFDRVLWPELLRLSARRDRTPSKPAPGWMPGRGPSLSALSAVIEQIEERGP